MKTRKVLYHLHKIKLIYKWNEIISQKYISYEKNTCEITAWDYKHCQKAFEQRVDFKNITIDWINREYSFIWAKEID